MKKKTTIIITMICAIGCVYSISLPAQVIQGDSLIQAVQITPVRAEEIAVAQAGGGTVMEIELERKNQQILYGVGITHDGRKHEIKIDATTGEIIRFKSSNLRRLPVLPQVQRDSLIQTAQISFAKAEEIAIARTGGGTVIEVGLERKSQQTFYEIEITHDGRKYEIKIDAASGDIFGYKEQFIRQKQRRI